MNATLNTLSGYLGDLLGETPTFVPTTRQETRNLPLLFTSLYGTWHTRLFKKDLILAVIQNSEIQRTPNTFAQHAERLQAAFLRPVALVLPHLASFQRNRLVQLGVPFIVPGRQLFIPNLLVDLRDHFPRAPRPMGQGLSPAAQLVLLYHLLKKPIDHVPLGDLAQTCGYTAMTLSNVARDLVGSELCKTVSLGRSRQLHFTHDKEKLWTLARPLLHSPVKRSLWVKGDMGNLHLPVAGMTALSEYTMLSDDPIPTYAIGDRDSRFQQACEKGDLLISPTSDDATAQLELWDYAPELLATDGVVDRLSLYLSIPNTFDERVQQATRQLLEGQTW